MEFAKRLFIVGSRYDFEFNKTIQKAAMNK